MPTPSLDLLSFHACLCFARTVLTKAGYYCYSIQPNPEAGYALHKPVFTQAGQNGWGYGDQFWVSMRERSIGMCGGRAKNLLIEGAQMLSWRPEKMADWAPIKPPAEVRLLNLPHDSNRYKTFARILEDVGISCMVPEAVRRRMDIEDQIAWETEMDFQADCAVVDAVRRAEFDCEWKPLAEMLY